MPDTDAVARWQPIVHRPGDGALFCGHVSYDPETGGWAVDCAEWPTFIRTAGDGVHEYACSRHVQEMSTDA